MKIINTEILHVSYFITVEAVSLAAKSRIRFILYGQILGSLNAKISLALTLLRRSVAAINMLASSSTYPLAIKGE